MIFKEVTMKESVRVGTDYFRVRVEEPLQDWKEKLCEYTGYSSMKELKNAGYDGCFEVEGYFDGKTVSGVKTVYFMDSYVGCGDVPEQIQKEICSFVAKQLPLLPSCNQDGNVLGDCEWMELAYGTECPGAEMHQLIAQLRKASDAYYNTGSEFMSNKEYDDLYDRLLKLEKLCGWAYPDSPTQKVGADVSDDDGLVKEKHEFPALSLAKTKNIDEYVGKFREQVKKSSPYGDVVLMWKMDGSTVQLTYDGGKLTKAVTRGNGEVGSVITHNAPYIKGIPMTIDYKGHMVVRGEAVMSYTEFERINDQMPADDKYANPRNLANATISLQEGEKMRGRDIQFFAFNLVHTSGGIAGNELFENRLIFLKKNGFQVVPYGVYPVGQLKDRMKEWENKVPDFDFPVDGLVCALNDAAYADTLPGTGHHPNIMRGYAFKWKDEVVKTKLVDIEWSPSRTGLINPVAVFEPVELEGTTVSRASLSNVSIVKKLMLRKGDTIGVFKANKIIPQVAENFTPGGKLTYAESHPLTCPCCGSEPEPRINTTGDTEIVVCPNPECPAKHIGRFTHFAERDCMDIEGMSTETVSVLVERGFLKEFADFYRLKDHAAELEQLERFGKKKVKNLLAAVEKSRTTSFVPFIHALGIKAIGKGQAKLLNKAYHGDVMTFFKDAKERHNFQTIEGIGEVLENNIWQWANEYLWFISVPDASGNLNQEIKNLMPYLTFEQEEETQASDVLAGKIFVITGDVHHFKNRDELKAYIESLGGKTSGSVSSKTSYLINNDVNSTSGKNKKAKELGIPVISEDKFLAMVK